MKKKVDVSLALKGIFDPKVAESIGKLDKFTIIIVSVCTFTSLEFLIIFRESSSKENQREVQRS